MGLAAPPLGGENEGLPGGKHHGLPGRGNASETLQEVEEVVLQRYDAWPHRLSELPLPDNKGRSDHGTRKHAGA
jgi:hypothetical protein